MGLSETFREGVWHAAAFVPLMSQGQLYMLVLLPLFFLFALKEGVGSLIYEKTFR